MEHDFDLLTQHCRACRLPRVVVADKPKFAACTGSERTRDMYGLTFAQMHRMRSITQPDEAAEIEKMPEPFRMYAQLLGRETVEKIAAEVFNRGSDETPLSERGFGT